MIRSSANKIRFELFPIRFQAWKEEFSRNKINYDFASLGLGFIIYIVSIHNWDTSYTGWVKYRAGFYLGLGFLLQILHFFLIYRHGNYFHKNRTSILVPRAMLQILMYYIFVASCPQIFHNVLPLQFDINNTVVIVRQLLFIPLILARVNVSYLVPLRDAKYIFLTGLPLVLYYNIFRCASEVTQIAGQGAMYKNLVKMIERQFSKWVPLPHFCVLGDAVRAAQLTETGACIATRNAPVVVLGYFFPMVFFYTEEINSRKKFEREQGLGTAFCHGPSTLFILHALLLPFQAAVTFHSIVYIAWLTKEWL